MSFAIRESLRLGRTAFWESSATFVCEDFLSRSLCFWLAKHFKEQLYKVSNYKDNKKNGINILSNIAFGASVFRFSFATYSTEHLKDICGI